MHTVQLDPSRLSNILRQMSIVSMRYFPSAQLQFFQSYNWKNSQTNIHKPPPPPPHTCTLQYVITVTLTFEMVPCATLGRKLFLSSSSSE